MKRQTWEQRWAGTNFGRVYQDDNSDGAGDARQPKAQQAAAAKWRIDSDTGWLSPAGQWYSCCEEGHRDLARELLEQLDPGNWRGPDRKHFGDPELELERRRYVKLAGESGAFCADESRVTPRQKRMLLEWFLSDANDCALLPWWLEPEDGAL